MALSEHTLLGEEGKTKILRNEISQINTPQIETQRNLKRVHLKLKNLHGQLQRVV